ncbi:hypothetical protein HPG69_005682 [Diceros bicornis minor]|uniref:G-protein coupled receptors family 1 profile domain-containing protein n=1 Tax=Diceros bicornis minor TaxID=77932 RepID=A0A7J7ESK6_DICBM|nr:hypothetical protein HPG69_005682 [Diceros bicornis minor]
MSRLNDTNIEVLRFLLIRIRGLEKSHIWIPIPLSFMYLLSPLGNFTVLFFIKTEPSLHEPMYYFLSMLSISDLGLSLSSLPTTLGLFLFGIYEIHAAPCFAQEFFIHLFTVTEASVLSVMAFDQYVAIHNPLRYSIILSTSRVIKAGTLCCPFYYSGFVVYYFSYIIILKTVLGIATPREQFKALNICISHISAVLLFYVPMLSAAILQHFARDLSPMIHILMADVFLLVPPLMNPIVHCVKTYQI